MPMMVISHRRPDRTISLTDPAASWTGAPGGAAVYAYSTNYLIDLDAGVIVDVQATHRRADRWRWNRPRR
jgi:hypothetical protein